jgi:hypothetical protein
MTSPSAKKTTEQEDAKRMSASANKKRNGIAGEEETRNTIMTVKL